VSHPKGGLEEAACVLGRTPENPGVDQQYPGCWLCVQVNPLLSSRAPVLGKLLVEAHSVTTPLLSL
jgi:hypothetical protein